jgi:hypothetical protein
MSLLLGLPDDPVPVSGLSVGATTRLRPPAVVVSLVTTGEVSSVMESSVTVVASVLTSGDGEILSLVVLTAPLTAFANFFKVLGCAGLAADAAGKSAERIGALASLGTGVALTNGV